MKVSMLIEELQACLKREGDLDVVLVDSEEQVISSNIGAMYPYRLTMLRDQADGSRYVCFTEAKDGDEPMRRVIAIKANDVGCGDNEYLKWHDSHKRS